MDSIKTIWHSTVIQIRHNVGIRNNELRCSSCIVRVVWRRYCCLNFVRPSFTLVDHVETVQDMSMWCSAYGTMIIQIFVARIHGRGFKSSPLNKGVKMGYLLAKTEFRLICRHHSEIVRDSTVVTVRHQSTVCQYMAKIWTRVWCLVFMTHGVESYGRSIGTEIMDDVV